MKNKSGKTMYWIKQQAQHFSIKTNIADCMLWSFLRPFRQARQKWRQNLTSKTKKRKKKATKMDEVSPWFIVIHSCKYNVKTNHG